MRGAIIGDIIGSPWEGRTPPEDPPLFIERSTFTDDTVMTVAVADAILADRTFKASFQDWYARYPDAGYGPTFERWAAGQIPEAPKSAGNGAVMRVSPCAWLAPDAEAAFHLAQGACAPSHNHEESYAAANAVTAAIWAGRRGEGRAVLEVLCEGWLGCELPSVADLKERSFVSVRAVPTAIAAFACVREASTFEGVMRSVLHLGGDCDTTGAVAGAVAEAMFGGVPEALWAEAVPRLPDDMTAVIDRFDRAVAAAAVPERPKKPTVLKRFRGLLGGAGM